MRMKRKKPWRKIKIRSPLSRYIRKTCIGILVLEAAFFIRDLDMSDWLYTSSREEVLQDSAIEPEKMQNDGSIYGLKFRFLDGILDIYWKEEVKN